MDDAKPESNSCWRAISKIHHLRNQLHNHDHLSEKRLVIERSVGRASSEISTMIVKVNQIPERLVRGLYYKVSKPDYPVVRDSQIKHATVEEFLHDITKESPIRFSPKQIDKFTKHFSKVIGSGGFGDVYKGEFPNGIQIAVKVLNRTSSNRVAEQFMAEIDTITRTYHMNLVRLFGFCFDKTLTALVYEYMELGSLDKLLFSDAKILVGFEKLHEIAIGIAKGIAYLHEECDKRIIHYDIKPGNVLLDTNLRPKVADFGLAMLCDRDVTHVDLSGCRGTPGYAAPEMWTPHIVTHKCDVYSFGMLLFEIIGRRRNYDPNGISNGEEWLPRRTYEKFVKVELSEMLMRFEIKEIEWEKAMRMVMVALWCVQYSPKARPLMSLVVKMLEGGTEIDVPPNPFEHLEDLISDYENSDGVQSSSENHQHVPSGKYNKVD